ncbi:hydroxypyruvate isomerase-like protein, partial [Dinothrombium tinctorium]
LDAVECQNPYMHTIDEWKQTFDECKSKRETLPKWVLINSIPAFDVFKSIPSIDEFKEKVLKKTLDYAIALNVSKVHLMLQDVNNENEVAKNYELLQFASRFMAPHNITCVIEPLSTRPKYYLRSYHQSKDIVNTLNEPNLKVMLDSFHMQKLHGNFTENVMALKDVIGHVQISQTPKRDSPMNPGEVDHSYILQLISEVYKDFVGLEYSCQTGDDLNWINNFTHL